MTDQPSRPGAGACRDDHRAHSGWNHAPASRSAPKANAVSRLAGTLPPAGVCPYAVTATSSPITITAVAYRSVRTLKCVAANPIRAATVAVTTHTTHDVIRPSPR